MGSEMCIRDRHLTAYEVANTPGFEGRAPDMSPAAGAAFRAVLAEVAEEPAKSLEAGSWSHLTDVLGDHDAADTVADGAAKKHSALVRIEAARKMIGNHDVVLADLTRPDGPPKTQPGLKRLPGREKDIDAFLKEVARRLLGRPSTESKKRCQPTSVQQKEAWAAAAAYLTGRLQVTQAEVAKTPGHKQRQADMGPLAGEAFKAVLAEVADTPVDSLASCTWGKLTDAIGAHNANDTIADGAGAKHGAAARHEAARKLIGNHTAVLGLSLIHI